MQPLVVGKTLNYRYSNQLVIPNAFRHEELLFSLEAECET